MSKTVLPDVDPEAIEKRLSLREKMAMRILWLMLTLVYPCKYSHQTEGIWKFIHKGGEDE